MNRRSQIRLRRAETANRKKMRIDGPRTWSVIERAIIPRRRIFLIAWASWHWGLVPCMRHELYGDINMEINCNLHLHYIWHSPLSVASDKVMGLQGRPYITLAIATTILLHIIWLQDLSRYSSPVSRLAFYVLIRFSNTELLIKLCPQNLDHFSNHLRVQIYLQI